MRSTCARASSEPWRKARNHETRKLQCVRCWNLLWFFSLRPMPQHKNRLAQILTYTLLHGRSHVPRRALNSGTHGSRRLLDYRATSLPLTEKQERTRTPQAARQDRRQTNRRPKTHKNKSSIGKQPHSDYNDLSAIQRIKKERPSNSQATGHSLNTPLRDSCKVS